LQRLPAFTSTIGQGQRFSGMNFYRNKIEIGHMRLKKRNNMERRAYQKNEPNTSDNRRTEHQEYTEYVWVSYSDDMNKKTEDEKDNSILERSNRFAL